MDPLVIAYRVYQLYQWHSDKKFKFKETIRNIKFSREAQNGGGEFKNTTNLKTIY